MFGIFGIFGIFELIAVAIWLIVLSGFIGYDKYGWATFVVALSIGVGVYTLGTDASWAMIVEYVTLTNAAIAVGGWLVAGAVVATVKWVAYSSKASAAYKSALSGYRDAVAKSGNDHVAALAQGSASELFNYWKHTSSESSSLSRRFDALKLNFDDETQKASYTRTNEFSFLVGAWITWWPIHIILFVLNDAIKAVVDFIVANFGTVFQRISNMFIKDLTV